MGAPSEEDQRGAIYIYLGGSSGISPSYSQRIPASELSPLLRGFGISISHGLDMDGNKYSGQLGLDLAYLLSFVLIDPNDSSLS